jgi:hypothetical protein
MKQESKAVTPQLYSLMPLENFKGLLGIDDRDDRLSGHCLETATKAIEHYCKRHFLRKKHFEQIDYKGDLQLALGEYPVHRVLVVYALTAKGGDGEIIEPDFYSVIPECGMDVDLQFSILLSRALQRYQGLTAIKVMYWAGYSTGLIPADLASACLELASWNMNRYKGRRIGMTGNMRGNGKDGEHFETSMPENVKVLLEPYRRKLI